MLHVALRAAEGTLLFRNWVEARALWDFLTTRLRPRALTLMPDHVHSRLRNASERCLLAGAMSAYARWRNARRGVAGPVWMHRETPMPIAGREHAIRTVRYIHLNPCRKGLVGDRTSCGATRTRPDIVSSARRDHSSRVRVAE